MGAEQAARANLTRYLTTAHETVARGFMSEVEEAVRANLTRDLARAVNETRVVEEQKSETVSKELLEQQQTKSPWTWATVPRVIGLSIASVVIIAVIVIAVRPCCCKKKSQGIGHQPMMVRIQRNTIK